MKSHLICSMNYYICSLSLRAILQRSSWMLDTRISCERNAAKISASPSVVWRTETAKLVRQCLVRQLPQTALNERKAAVEAAKTSTLMILPLNVFTSIWYLGVRDWRGRHENNGESKYLIQLFSRLCLAVITNG